MGFHDTPLYAWGVYALSVILTLTVAGRCTRRWRRDVRRLALSSLAVLLGVPWSVEPGGAWAPALIILLYDGMTQGWHALPRAGIPLFAALGVTYLLLLLEVLLRRPQRPDQ